MATQALPRKKAKVTAAEKAAAEVVTGPASAALISGGIGSLVIGMMTTAAVISEPLKEALNWWNPAGPLTGKTGIGVIAWLISWFLLNTIWKGKDYDIKKAFTITLVLISLGLLLTFPPIFEAFEK